MSAEKNIRRHRRISHINPVRISWEEQGQSRYAMARCIDISHAGLRIESPYPIRPGTVVQVGAERLGLAGGAAVKHMVRAGSKFLLGVELLQSALGEKIAEIEGRPKVTVDIENFNRIDQKV
ncbi:MAG: PilZ domain-containing protein [Bryobacteraceae bacterium]|jgi:hypothetical protein